MVMFGWVGWLAAFFPLRVAPISDAILGIVFKSFRALHIIYDNTFSRKSSADIANSMLKVEIIFFNINPCSAEPGYILNLQIMQIQISWLLKPTIWICTVCH